MKMLSLFLLIAYFNVNVHTQSTKLLNEQTVTVTQATAQRWSGGIVGRRGVKYNIVVETTPNVLLDTIWIGKTPYDVRVNSDPRDYMHPSNATLTKTSKRWAYDVLVNVDQSVYGAPGDTTAEQLPPSRNVPKYNGAALVQYEVASTRGSAIIKAFTQLDPLNFP